MTARLIVASEDLRSYPKGSIICIVTGDKPFGPNTETKFVQLTISDATREEAHKYVDHWVVDFSHTLINENASGWRFRIEVDPIYVSVSNVGKDVMKAKMQDFVTRTGSEWEGCVVQNFTTSSMTVRVPKNGVWQTAKSLSDIDYLKALKRDFSDIFRTTLRIDRYHFAEADVDAAITAGRQATITKAQALSKLIDRLDE